jgi:hypothetical protein
MIPVPTRKIEAGMDHTTVCSPRKRMRSWTLSLGQSMVSAELVAMRSKRQLGHRMLLVSMAGTMAELINPVWCWGWDGAGDLDGPDVDPIWEKMPNKSFSPDSIRVKHARNMQGWM